MDGRIIIVFFVIYLVNGQVQNDTLEHRVGDLEAEVRKLVGLKVKFEKIDALLESLESLCSKYNSITKSENIGDDEDVNNIAPGEQGEEHDEDGFVDFGPSFKIVSVESGGLIDNTITVKVVFRSKRACAIRWNVMHEMSTFLLWEGEIHERMLTGNVRLCASIIELTEVDRLEWVYANILGIDDHIQLTFNITALHDGGAEPIEEFKYKILQYSPTVIMDKNRTDTWGIETTFKVSNNVINRMREDYASSVHGSFQYVNTTTTPAEIKSGFMTDDIAVEIKNGTENELVVRVKNEIAEFGGLLFLTVKQGETTYLRDCHYDVSIQVIQSESGNVMPEGVIAVYKQEEIQYYYGKYYSVQCVAASIPASDMQIYKVEESGQLKQLPEDADVFEKMFHLKVINFVPANIEQLEGEYVCRVRLGNKSVDQRFTVLKYEEIQFDEMGTRVVENSRKQMIISCKATGVPTPDIGLLVYDSYGQDMIKSTDVSYTHNLATHKNSVEIMMKIKPINPDIHTVVCVAFQRMDGEIAYRREFPFKIKPDI